MKRYVITGGPGCGKSSIISALEVSGETVVPEAAESFIRYQKARGVENPFLDPSFEDNVLKLQLQKEKHAPNSERVFFDRGILDAWAYYQLQGRDPSELMHSVIEELRGSDHYQTIFLVDHIGKIENNYSRREDLESAVKLGELQGDNYRSLGYNVVKIPVASIEERMEYVMKHLD
jgi:predicted ATPase